MPQEEKFKREIDRIGLLLAKLLGILLHKPNHHEEKIKDVLQQVKVELEIDIPLLLEMDSNGSLEYLVNERKFSHDHLRVFANLLYELAGNTSDNDTQTKIRNKALSIYEYIHANAVGTLYLDVVYRIKELKNN